MRTGSKSAFTSVLQLNKFKSPEKQRTFHHNGLGPFTVGWKNFRKEILETATSQQSVHISGCRGAGKTTLLQLLGCDLKALDKEVYYFDTATTLNDTTLTQEVTALIEKKEEAYFLIDETQTVGQAIPSCLIKLLKNNSEHNLITIGAGVPAFETTSGQFTTSFLTDRLFLKPADLKEEGVIDYFAISEKEPLAKVEVENLLEHIRVHCGGHIYPLMRAAELLVPKLHSASATVIQQHYDISFRATQDYEGICNRILPPITIKELEPLLVGETQGDGILNLQKKGLATDSGKLLSQLLLEASMKKLNRTEYVGACIEELMSGVDGISQILKIGCMQMLWKQYDKHGGAVEDALTFELLMVLKNIPQLTTQLFNPKLVDVGTPGRRPDIYVNSKVNSYIECLLSLSTDKKSKTALEEHIDRFCSDDDDDAHDAMDMELAADKARYRLVEGQEWAVLNYQKTGQLPIEPSLPYDNLFQKHVFTFLMASKQLYLGSLLIHPIEPIAVNQST
jgi:hypothetical protein